jgi:hypothetical protein
MRREFEIVDWLQWTNVGEFVTTQAALETSRRTGLGQNTAIRNG